MFTSLSEDEERFANRILKGGIALANLSLGKIIQSPTLIKMISWGLNELDNLNFNPNHNGSTIVMRTQLYGKIEGVNYLIFSREELEALFRACLPEEIVKETSGKSEIMKEGLLSELSNVMVSSVITELADMLGVEMFGTIPIAHEVPSTEVDEFIRKNSGNFDSMLHIQTSFKGKVLDIMPHFIWILHQDFLSAIKKEAEV
jgi:chemotaxis protein CheY-P-specific phosphatase CheC